MNFEKILYELKDKIAYIGFGFNSSKKMNVLDKLTLTELREVFEIIKKEVEGKKITGVILHSLTPGCFLAGVDINLISSLQSEAEILRTVEEGHTIFNMIEDLKIPKVACIDGVCMGGGLELALTCDKILVSESDNTVLALPEVKLGLLPGLGGTYRLPRRIGIPNALDLILTGSNVRAKKAKRMGLADEVYAKEKLLEMAKSQLFSSAKKLKRSEVLEKMIMKQLVVRKFIFKKARESVLEKTKGFYQAPLKILSVMEAGSSCNRKTGLAKEAAGFTQLALSEQSKNLRHIFFLVEGTKKYKAEPVQDRVKKIKKGAVLGAGTMGGGIAWLLADNYMSPLLKDVNKEALELGLSQASSVFSKSVKKKHMTEEEFQRKQRSISPTLDYSCFKSVDLVIEAVVEKIDLKKAVFKELENYVREDAIITSNTSSISIEKMCEGLKRPERFLGLHFFNPVNMMPLVEIITHSKVSEEVVKQMHAWALAVKKTPIIVNDGPGFLVNRILTPFLSETVWLLEEGCSVEQLDRAILSFGMPMGPGRLLDEVGFDVAVHVSEVIYGQLGERCKFSDLLHNIVQAGFLGKKNHKGFYYYNEQGKQLGINEELKKLCPNKSCKIAEEDIQKRLILPMINEATYALQDKIAEHASTIDIGVIFGLGFPPFRGGLLKYADNVGLNKILADLKELEVKVSSNRFKPSQYLQDMVAHNKNFYN
ncbi:MAG: hypothetical protein A2202_07065 [Bdellovibrionales bacterium RIFOXYA1_FULL_36_14]|nr:MAG: hypothetical protein A2202_07065 [Bdellovibrionales bacterium RIFOXYA1_FULL_36_14]